MHTTLNCTPQLPVVKQYILPRTISTQLKMVASETTVCHAAGSPFSPLAPTTSANQWMDLITKDRHPVRSFTFVAHQQKGMYLCMHVCMYVHTLTLADCSRDGSEACS
jgi:hypothetical protein